MVVPTVNPDLAALCSTPKCCFFVCTHAPLFRQKPGILKKTVILVQVLEFSTFCFVCFTRFVKCLKIFVLVLNVLNKKATPLWRIYGTRNNDWTPPPFAGVTMNISGKDAAQVGRWYSLCCKEPKRLTLWKTSENFTWLTVWHPTFYGLPLCLAKRGFSVEFHLITGTKYTPSAKCCSFCPSKNGEKTVGFETDKTFCLFYFT